MAACPFSILALCSGIGGIELGIIQVEPAARVVCHVEREAFAACVLAARMSEGCLPEAPIWSDIMSFDPRPWRGVVDCISGGFPCQPFSIAGAKRAKSDDRHLWPRIAEIIGVIEPEWCFFENVANMLNLVGEVVVGDLCRMGYRVAGGIFTASGAGLPHERRRVFLLAHAESRGRGVFRGTQGRQREPLPPLPPVGLGDGIGVPPPFDDMASWCGVLERFPHLAPSYFGPNETGRAEVEAESCFHRMVDGISPSVDRIRALGNAVSPPVAAQAWRELKEALTCVNDDYDIRKKAVRQEV